MGYYLYDRFGVSVSTSTIHDVLTRRGWNRKVAKKITAERSEPLRALFRAKSVFWHPQQIVFVDESASNERTGDRKYGWSPVSNPCHDYRYLKRDKRWSVLPALTLNGYLRDPLIIQGAVTKELFLEWMAHVLLPQLEPGMILVLDNASIHHGVELSELCMSVGVRVEYLPPYSPDLNPIEQSFNVLKA